jgi:tetratricopeptide (TPR) repeat protein
MKLAAGLRDGGDLPGAIALLEEARRRGDESLDLQQDLAISYAAAGRQDAARVLFTNLSQRYPATPTVWFNVGLFEMQSRRPAEAAAAFRHAVEREPAYGEAWQGLGAALVGSNTQDAIAAWKRAEALLPRDYDLLFNLGMVLADSPTPGDAVPYLRRFVAEAPRAHYAPDIDKVRQLLGRIERRPR